jgi:hypothetical protein
VTVALGGVGVAVDEVVTLVDGCRPRVLLRPIR